MFILCKIVARQIPALRLSSLGIHLVPATGAPAKIVPSQHSRPPRSSPASTPARDRVPAGQVSISLRLSFP